MQNVRVHKLMLNSSVIIVRGMIQLSREGAINFNLLNSAIVTIVVVWRGFFRREDIYIYIYF